MSTTTTTTSAEYYQLSKYVSTVSDRNTSSYIAGYGNGRITARGSYFTSTKKYVIERNRIVAFVPETYRRSDIAISKLKINYTIKNDGSAFSAVAKVLTQTTIGKDADVVRSAIDSVSAKRQISVAAGTQSGSITLTDATEISNAAAYGIAFLSSVDNDYAYRDVEYAQTGVSADGEFTNLQFEITYDASGAKPTITLSNAGIMGHDITEPLPLSWTYNHIGGSAQASVEIWMRLAGQGTEYQKIATYTGTAQTYSVPPEKFPGLVEGWAYRSTTIKVKAVSGDGVSSEFSDAITKNFYFPLCELTQPASGAIKLSGDVITLAWSVKSALDKVLTRYPELYDLAYSKNSGETWVSIADKTEVVQSGADCTYAIPANTLPSGIVMWRVLPYVNGGTNYKYYSDVFSVRVQASTSAVVCDGKPRPRISWTSSSQVAYQVRFAEYDSGAVYSTDKYCDVPYVYPDGYYPVQVRTQATDGKWSAWTELQYVAIANTAQTGAISLTVAVTRHAAALYWTDAGTTEKYVVYRNGVQIYVGTGKTYTDIRANGSCTYVVRAMKSNGYYAESNTVTVSAYPAADCMYDMTEDLWISLKYSLEARTRVYSKSGSIAYKYYAGRRKPVAFDSGYTTQKISVSCATRSRDEAMRISQAIGHTVIYKDTRGGTIIGVLDEPVITVLQHIYSATFTITEIDYAEAVAYED